MTFEELVEFKVIDGPRSHHTPDRRFLASLSDGRTIVQDHREGEPHGWHRATEYMRTNPGLRMTGFRLQLKSRNYMCEMPGNQLGYFYIHSVRKVWGAPHDAKFIGIGYYDGTAISIVWHKAPDLDRTRSETRDKFNRWVCLPECGPNITLNEKVRVGTTKCDCGRIMQPFDYGLFINPPEPEVAR